MCIRDRHVSCLIATYPVTIYGKKMPVVLGAIVYQYKDISYRYVRFSFDDLWNDFCSLYILTLGVVNEVRKLGIGSILIRKIVEEGRANYVGRKLRYVYLHVVDYNKTARSFYERNGFYLVGRKREHYTIFDNSYDALVYALYFDGAQLPMSTFTIMKGWMLSFLGFINVPHHMYTVYKLSLIHI
eukprot:TRINITY_DN33113_c0_g1_i1.p1 TRINITY_DN33113_c0_g1~~TRINITY_DN33113_c0_g1_i1.p1  ORF type:complete len:205 (-),score=32.28 TRINITY_DN33113_c0_g1_i1:60-614(-)